jgi:hypothetical protein
LAKAFYTPIANEILEYVEKKNISIHSEALNLRSSQVCCFNFLFPLKKDKDLARIALTPLLPQVTKVSDIEFEYTGPDGITQWLGEPPGGKRGQNRTSIDAAIWWLDEKNRTHITLVEWKYTERSFGSCGGFESDSNKHKELCRYSNPSRNPNTFSCFLTRGGPQTSRQYWNLLGEADISKEKLATSLGCPIKGPFYQLFRQSLFAGYLRTQKEADKVDIVVISFSQNESLLDCPKETVKILSNGHYFNTIEAWNTVLSDNSCIRHTTIEDMLLSVENSNFKSSEWRKYIKERYGV